MELMRLKGTNGTIVVYEDRVVIERKGLFAVASQGFKGDKTFFYSDISSVDYKKPGMVNGYLRLLTAGSNSSSPKADLWGTSKETMSDENTVVLRAFNNATPEESEKIYHLILEQLQNVKGKVSSVSIEVSSADEIKKYKELFDQGIITESEFIAKKKQLLGI